MMSDLIKTLKQIALRKRDEKGEQGKRVSEKGFVEWKAADRIAELETELAEGEALSSARTLGTGK